MNKAINRTTVQVENNKYKVYPKAAPLFYKKSDFIICNSYKTKRKLSASYDKKIHDFP